MIVGNIMTKNPITIGPADSVTEAKKIMQREKIHRLPVVDKNHGLVGMVTEKDLLYASPSPATTLDVYEISDLLSKLKVSRVMTKDVRTVTADTPLEDAARVMVDSDIGGLPVVREDMVVGIITESDLFKVFMELFGARRKGIRATVLLPEKRGELAAFAGAIAEKGGNIIALGTFPGDDPSNAYCTIKVSDISREDFVAAVKPFVDEIRDVRES